MAYATEDGNLCEYEINSEIPYSLMLYEMKHKWTNSNLFSEASTQPLSRVVDLHPFLSSNPRPGIEGLSWPVIIHHVRYIIFYY